MRLRQGRRPLVPLDRASAPVWALRNCPPYGIEEVPMSFEVWPKQDRPWHPVTVVRWRASNGRPLESAFAKLSSEESRIVHADGGLIRSGKRYEKRSSQDSSKIRKPIKRILQ